MIPGGVLGVVVVGRSSAAPGSPASPFTATRRLQATCVAGRQVRDRLNRQERGSDAWIGAGARPTSTCAHREAVVSHETEATPVIAGDATN